MKPHIYILFFLLFGQNQVIIAQNIDTLKKSDTIYIYFDYGKNQTVERLISKNSNFHYYDNYKTYKFEIDFLNYIYFISNDYRDFDSYNKNIKMDVLIKPKKNLQKNKNKIIDINFMLENGMRETFFAIYGDNKKIYLIDKNEIKCRKIKLREVIMSSPFIEE